MNSQFCMLPAASGLVVVRCPSTVGIGHNLCGVVVVIARPGKLSSLQLCCSACGRIIACALMVLRRATALLRPGAEAELADQRRHLLRPSPDLVLDLVGLHVHERTGAQPGQEALEAGAPAGRRLRLAIAAATAVGLGGRCIVRLLADRHLSSWNQFPR